MTGSVMTNARRPCRAATPPAALAMPVPNRTSSGLRRTASSGIGLQEVGEDGEELLPPLDRRHVAAAPEGMQPRVGQLLEERKGGGGERREPVVRAMDQQNGR